jgi:hypothetical protein
MGSAGEAFSNQSIGWCCIDRLSRQDLPGVNCANTSTSSLSLALPSFLKENPRQLLFPSME